MLYIDSTIAVDTTLLLRLAQRPIRCPAAAWPVTRSRVQGYHPCTCVYVCISREVGPLRVSESIKDLQVLLVPSDLAAYTITWSCQEKGDHDD